MRDRAEPETPVTESVVIVDVASLGVKQAWGARSYASNISRILATSYPEVLDRVYVCGRYFFLHLVGFILWVDFDLRYLASPYLFYQGRYNR